MRSRLCLCVCLYIPLPLLGNSSLKIKLWLILPDDLSEIKNDW
jgi:hypothetical protein